MVAEEFSLCDKCVNIYVHFNVASERRGASQSMPTEI